MTVPYKWKVVPICDFQKLDVRPEVGRDALNSILIPDTPEK